MTRCHKTRKLEEVQNPEQFSLLQQVEPPEIETGETIYFNSDTPVVGTVEEKLEKVRYPAEDRYEFRLEDSAMILEYPGTSNFNMWSEDFGEAYRVRTEEVLSDGSRDAEILSELADEKLQNRKVPED